MERLTRWIVRRFIRGWEDVNDPNVRSRYGLLEGYASIVFNFVLAGIKFALGVSMSSAGLIADAVHSLSDMASSIVVILGFSISSKPPDPEHPFGHAKAEYVATLVVALLMVVVGVEIGQEGVMGMWEGPREDLPPLTWGLFAALMVLLVAKELLGGFSRALGRMIGSSALEADAWHHRSDALSTGVVIAGLWGRNLGLPWLDGAAGVLVALWIIYTGFKMAWDAVSPLLGEMAPPEDIEAIRAIAASVPGVENTHDIKVHNYGHFNFTTIHAELSDRLDVHRMHELTTLVEMRILNRFPGECVVHMDPVNLHHPMFHLVFDALKDAVIAHPELVEFRDLNLWSDEGLERGGVEITVNPNTPEGRYFDLAREVEREVRQKFPALDFSVRLKVDFSAEPLKAL